MTRSFCYCVFAAGALAALMVLGAQSSWAQEEKPPVATTATKQPEIKEVGQAVERFKNRDIAGAKKLLEDAYKAHPELPPPPIILAQFFAQANQAGLMHMALEDAVINYQADPEAYVILANIALQERRVTEASLLYDKATALLPKLSSPKRKEILDAQTVSGLAGVAETRAGAMEKGSDAQTAKWKEAQTLLEKLLTLMPKDKEANVGKAQATLRLARAKFQQGNATGAYADLKAAYDLDKEKILTPEAALGGFYEQYGDHEKAVKWMGVAVSAKFYPKDLQTRLAVGRWALETNQLDEALKHAAAALQIDDKSLDAIVLRGIIALFTKDYATAEKLFLEAHSKSPTLFAASNNLALALCEQKDKTKIEKGLGFASNNSQQNQKNAEAASTLGWVLFKKWELDKTDRQLLDKAEQILGMVARSGNVNADTAYYLAQVSYARDRKAEAKSLLKLALQKDAKDRPRLFSMRPEAESLYEKVKDEPDPVAKPDTAKKDASK